MNVGKQFRDILTFDGEEAIFNGLTFTVNKEHTHFEASSIMTQCALHLRSLDKRGLPSKHGPSSFVVRMVNRLPIVKLKAVIKNLDGSILKICFQY